MFNIEKFKFAINSELRERKLKRRTADDYVSRLERVNELFPNYIPTCKDLVDGVLSIAGNTQGRKFINAIQKYEKLVMGKKGVYLFGNDLSRLYKSYTPEGIAAEFSADTFLRKIRGMPNEKRKLKLGLMLQIMSGLRVSEIAHLRKKDIIFTDKPEDEEGHIGIYVINSKQAKSRYVNVLPDKWLTTNLKDYLADKADDEKLFYAENTIQTATDYKTHDLRKANAELRFNLYRKIGMTKNPAVHKIAPELGHEKIGMTKKHYLVGKYPVTSTKKATPTGG